MKQDSSPFDARPDPVIGAALRHALAPADHDRFVARVLARAEQMRTATWDAVLARWARLGVAAAMIVALAAGYFVGRGMATVTPARATLPDALIAPATQGSPAEVVFASVIEN
jgi:hypothetical protein